MVWESTVWGTIGIRLVWIDMERDMKTKIFIDGSEGTTGLRIHERFAGREDIEALFLHTVQSFFSRRRYNRSGKMQKKDSLPKEPYMPSICWP